MKKILLFAGLPGVGKSTISRGVGEIIGAKVVDIDHFKKSIVDSAQVKSEIDPPELRWTYYKEALDHAFELLDNNESIIAMDEVFHLQSLRSRLEAYCTVFKTQVIWIEVRCSYRVVKKRLSTQERDGHLLSTDETLRMHLMFREIFEKFPDSHQNYIAVDNEESSGVNLLVGDILEIINDR